MISLKHRSLYFISTQNESCISCTQNHCVKRTKPTKHEFPKNGIVENNLRILHLCQTPETDSRNPWGSIEPRLRTTGIGCSPPNSM